MQVSPKFVFSLQLQVAYSVNGEGGYVADVTYTGEAQYPPEPAGGYGRK